MDTKEKKTSEHIISSKSKKYAHLNKQIKTGGNTFSTIQRKTKEELAKEMEAKKELTRQQENIKKFGGVLFLNLKDIEDNSTIANNYLFELIKDNIKGKKAYHGLYKIDVIKKNADGIICRITGAKKYKNEFRISNEQIMQKKPEKDRLEEAYTMTKTYITPKGEKIKKTRPGRKEDFLYEIEYGDSVIIDVQDGKIRKVNPDDIIEEIGGYIKKNDNDYIKSRKIQTAMKFFNESKEKISSEYIKDFMNKLVKNKESQWNKMGKKGQIPQTNEEHFAEVLKRYLNKEKLYVHRENDIDKSAVKFLLEKFGIKPGKVFNEIDHSDIENITTGVFLDVGETAHGIKVIEKVIGKNKKGKEIKETKKIISEHTDASDKAILSNRPSSTTQIIFKIFKELGAIDKEQLPHIQRFVNFVNTVDSMEYQISSIDYKNNYQTLFGLYHAMDIQDIFEYFKNPENNGFEKLSEGYMKGIKTINEYDKKTDKTLLEISKKHKERIEKNISNFEELKKSGKELEYLTQGTKFIVDMENKLQDGPQTAGYHGYGLFKIYPERGNIYIYSPKKFPVMIEGFPTDGHFLIINTPTPEDLEKLFEKFHTENAALKNSIIDSLKKIQEGKKQPMSKEDISLRCKMLPELAKKDLKIGKTYTGVINNDIQNKIAYITLDKEEKIKGRIKVEDRNELKKYKKGDLIKVKIDEISEEEGKLLTLSLVGAKE